jgi:hypothetical protein
VGRDVLAMEHLIDPGGAVLIERMATVWCRLHEWTDETGIRPDEVGGHADAVILPGRLRQVEEIDAFPGVDVEGRQQIRRPRTPLISTRDSSSHPDTGTTTGRRPRLHPYGEG